MSWKDPSHSNTEWMRQSWYLICHVSLSSTAASKVQSNILTDFSGALNHVWQRNLLSIGGAPGTHPTCRCHSAVRAHMAEMQIIMILPLSSWPDNLERSETILKVLNVTNVTIDHSANLLVRETPTIDISHSSYFLASQARDPCDVFTSLHTRPRPMARQL